jgi:hypothetical protein
MFFFLKKRKKHFKAGNKYTLIFPNKKGISQYSPARRGRVVRGHSDPFGSRVGLCPCHFTAAKK